MPPAPSFSTTRYLPSWAPSTASSVHRRAAEVKHSMASPRLDGPLAAGGRGFSGRSPGFHLASVAAPRASSARPGDGSKAQREQRRAGAGSRRVELLLRDVVVHAVCDDILFRLWTQVRP